MGATSSKPASADGQPASNRGCASWSNWSNNDDETKAKSAAAKDNNKEGKAAAPSSLASKPAETQTEMLIRIKEITEVEGVWYTAFERLAGNTKSVLPIDTVVTSVASVPIDDGKRVRLPTTDEARATIAANIDGAPSSINVKSWAKLFLAITSGWSLQRIEISARAASKKISSADAVNDIEAALAARRASTDIKDAKSPINEKSGQSSTVPEEPVSPFRPVDVVLAAAAPILAPILAPVPAKDIAASSVTLPEFEPVATIEPSEPVTGGLSLPTPEPVPAAAAAPVAVTEEVAPSEPSPKSTTAVESAVAEAVAAVAAAESTPTITTGENAEDAPVSPSPASPEIKTPGGSSNKKKGGKGKQAAAPPTPKTPTPPSQPPPPVKQQGSQKNLTATTPKGSAGAPAKGKKGKK